mgnify:CR=1 FL=1
MDLKKILPTDGPPVEEVLKYVEKYKNEIIVIKYGGNVFIDRKIFDNFIKDLSVLNKLGLQVVVVHGGGPRIKRELSKQNIVGWGRGTAARGAAPPSGSGPACRWSP